MQLLFVLGVLGIGGCAAWCVNEALDIIATRYERRTGRSWTTGEPL